MKKNLEITKEEAIKLYSDSSSTIQAIFESTFGEETFKPKKITDKIQNLEDVYTLLGIPAAYPFTYPKDKEDKSIAAYSILLSVVKAYNEGWVAEWSNINQYKYYPYLYKNPAGSWSAHYYDFNDACDSPVGLAFKSSELALDAINKFRDLYNDYYMVS